MSKNKNFIKKTDYDRVILTETLPYETPIIFSNAGLYMQIKNKGDGFKKELLEKLILNEKATKTKPFFFKIKKNELEYRRLALLHPNSQIKIKEFYQKYDSLIVYFCNQSPASIRSPKSVAGSFYLDNSQKDKFEEQGQNITLADQDINIKHMLSYFAYNGYIRLYKFFVSEDYFLLEKKFAVQMTLDVSKCFDSIYTHSIGWATKNKEFAKNHLSNSSFGDKFDTVLRSGNDNETNGIVIGPEVSRIFAEIIFQKVDKTVIDTLNKKEFYFDQNYAIRRYVDDVFIFASTEDDVKKIYNEYVNVLWNFNLHANTAKTIISHRPFVSKKTRLIYQANEVVNSYFNKMVTKTKGDNLILAKINSVAKFKRAFIDSIKNLCAQYEMKYDDIASYIISVQARWVKDLIKLQKNMKELDNNSGSSNSQNTEQINQEEIEIRCYKIFNIIIEIAFFLYSVAPTVNSSYKLSSIIIRINNFVEKNMPSFKEEIANQLFNLTCQLFTAKSKKQELAQNEAVNLELINIMIALSVLDDQYKLPEYLIEELFFQTDKTNYFSIISLLFYIKNEDEYSGLKDELVKIIEIKLADLNDLESSSEKIHLLLDTISCPYITSQVRERLIMKLLEKIKFETKKNIDEILKEVNKCYWFVNWNKEVSLLNFLVKKEIQQVY